MTWPLPYWGGGGGFEVDVWNPDTDKQMTVCVPAASRDGAHNGAREALPRPWKSLSVRRAPTVALGEIQPQQEGS